MPVRRGYDDELDFWEYEASSHRSGFVKRPSAFMPHVGGGFWGSLTAVVCGAGDGLTGVEAWSSLKWG